MDKTMTYDDIERLRAKGASIARKPISMNVTVEELTHFTRVQSDSSRLIVEAVDRLTEAVTHHEPREGLSIDLAPVLDVLRELRQEVVVNVPEKKPHAYTFEIENDHRGKPKIIKATPGV